tara:strand:- start:498 stop:719 length:222 start_codon:yes stop_codon:yes gene_type:complete
MKVVKVCTTRQEADFIKMTLEAYNIKVFIRADDAGGLVPDLSLTGGIDILVSEEQFLEAQELIKDLDKDQSSS